MRYLKYLFVIASLILLSGCWDSEENERILYVHGVGIDYKNQEYQVYIQIISFANVARSEQIDQDVMQSEVGFSTGKTVNEAFANLYKSVDEKLFFGHLTFMIFSEDMLIHGKLNEVLNSFTRYLNTRYQTWIYATDQPIEQFFLETPLLKKSITLTKLANPLNSYEQDSYIEPLNVRKLIIQLNEPNYLAKIPYITIGESWITEQGNDSSFQIEGVALVTPSEFHGYLIKEEANGLQWISKETIASNITTNLKGSNITFTNRNHKVKITPIVNGNNVKFQIDISVNSIMNSYNVNTTEKELRESVEQAIKNEVLQTYKIGLEKNLDVYRLSEILYRKNVKLWNELEKNGVIPLTEDSIKEVNVKVKKLKAGRTIYKNSLDTEHNN
jgi:spore germination protein KC